jgi:prepilin peptidase CpaA
MAQATLLTGICIGLLLAAAMHDVAARMIPNPLPLALALGGVALRNYTGDTIPALLSAGLVFLLAGVCWIEGWLGGGDVKLFGAVSLVVPAGTVPAFILTAALAGGMLALLYLLARKLVAQDSPPILQAKKLNHLGGSYLSDNVLARLWRTELWRIRRGEPLPYAVAIAAAGALTLLGGGSL